MSAAPGTGHRSAPGFPHASERQAHQPPEDQVLTRAKPIAKNEMPNFMATIASACGRQLEGPVRSAALEQSAPGRAISPRRPRPPFHRSPPVLNPTRPESPWPRRPRGRVLPRVMATRTFRRPVQVIVAMTSSRSPGHDFPGVADARCTLRDARPSAMKRPRQMIRDPVHVTQIVHMPESVHVAGS